jgi:hypothetical protein
MNNNLYFIHNWCIDTEWKKNTKPISILCFLKAAINASSSRITFLAISDSGALIMITWRNIKLYK